ncbi:MAG: Hsp20/alpha crystallin family protein [Steroidobacteraceae bacterium]
MSQPDTPEWLWADAFDLLDKAERQTQQCFRMGAPRDAQSVWEPPVDLIESDAGIELVVALPGVEPENLHASFDGQALQISALRRLPAVSTQVIHLLEIPCGRFERRIPVPPGPYAALEQTYANGCLHLHLRKVSAHP